MKAVLIHVTPRTHRLILRDRWAALVGDSPGQIGAEAMLWAALHDESGECAAITRSATALVSGWTKGSDIRSVEAIKQPPGCAYCGGAATLKPLFSFLQQSGLWLEAEASCGRLSAWLTATWGESAVACTYNRGSIKHIRG